MISSTQEFRADWVSPPGDTITDILRERGISEYKFAQEIGYTPEDTRNLLQGRTAITIEIARKLKNTLGASVEFWMSRDFQYREDVARLCEADEEWLAELPVGDMIKFGWLKPVPHASDEMAVCLHFFDVSTVREWHDVYRSLEQSAVFRTSRSFDSRPAAVAAWLRQGEIEAQAIDCDLWNPSRFHKSFSYIRSLTREKDPNLFLPKLQKCCSESGVAVVIVRSPNGCRASGATRFLSRDKAILQLSFRYLSDDQFWFTFFHEVGHLLLHGEKGFFLEGADTISTREEEEANEFGARILVPEEYQSALWNLQANGREVIRFARRLDVSPGIIVGQLQHLRKIRPNQLNNLKRRFFWQD